MKFSQDMDRDDPKVDFEGQGHRSKVKVIRIKNVISGNILQSYRLCVHGKRSSGSRSNITWVKVKSHGSRSG